MANHPVAGSPCAFTYNVVRMVARNMEQVDEEGCGPVVAALRFHPSQLDERERDVLPYYHTDHIL